MQRIVLVYEADTVGTERVTCEEPGYILALGGPSSTGE